ncbi:MAG: twin-arginine translocation signal domain-containing protein, partial [Bacteroidetes bacterium]|nr:twin-arginine translocation signal domain-containing protein [Bacteroidota bacterium]
MDLNRRNFLKTTAAATAVVAANPYGAIASNVPQNIRSGKMVLRYRPYTLELKHVFTVAVSSRT